MNMFRINWICPNCNEQHWYGPFAKHLVMYNVQVLLADGARQISIVECGYDTEQSLKWIDKLEPQVQQQTQLAQLIGVSYAGEEWDNRRGKKGKS